MGDDKKKYDLERTLLFAPILTIITIAILLVLCHFYARWLNRRQARRENAIFGQYLQNSSNQVILNEPPKMSLDPLVVSALPMFHYGSMNRLDHGGTTECSVCLSTIDDEATVRLLPICKHLFHVECIDTWLASHTTCPVCRSTVEPVATEVLPTVTMVQPTAPPLDEGNSTVPTEKVSGSSSQLSSFRRMLRGERSSRRTQSCEEISGLERV
ncbi:Zinc finger, RING-type [Dillenia turbinata]|uniref:RING-type E3 ubiquitin transferase n=1 Tax=Dillenia turbinata TaxID=194707 RepID=A0AAN8ZA97_9MAGN